MQSAKTLAGVYISSLKNNIKSRKRKEIEIKPY